MFAGVIWTQPCECLWEGELQVQLYNLKMAEELETERLLLRNWRDSDLETWIEMNQDVEVMRYFPKPLTREEATAMRGRFQIFLDEHEYGFWAVEVKGLDPFIGFVGLNDPRLDLTDMPSVEIGWRLHKSAWGKGYASEAATRALSFGLKELRIPEIVSFTSTINRPSMKVMERIGLHRRTDLDFEHPRVEEGHILRPHVVYSSNPGATPVSSL